MYILLYIDISIYTMYIIILNIFYYQYTIYRVQQSTGLHLVVQSKNLK